MLESVRFPGQHVGVLPDGSIKPPTQTGKGPHAQFKPTLHQRVSLEQTFYNHIEIDTSHNYTHMYIQLVNY